MTLISPVIGFDIDGVLADFTRAFADMAQEMYGLRARSSGAQLHWRFPLTEEQETAVWARIDSGNGRFWRELKPLITDGELDDMWDLQKDGYHFTYVTSRHSRAKQATGQWLIERQLPKGGLHFVKHKAPYLAEVENLKSYIDDSPEQITAMYRMGIPGVHVRDWPYNRDVNLPAARVTSVGEYLALVSGVMIRAERGGTLWRMAVPSNEGVGSSSFSPVLLR